MTVDLHTHILPGIDDGSPDLETSLELLKKEEDNGVTTVVLTPHFRFEKQEIGPFLQQREAAYAQLKKAAEKVFPSLQLRLGAEVRYSTRILEEESRALCMQNTGYMLVEFSVHHRPQFVEDVFYKLQLSGITPVIAHVERYPYLEEKPELLYEYVKAGALAQVNAASITDYADRRRLIEKWAAHSLVHVVATDTHHPGRRPPKLREAMALLEAKLGKEQVAQMEQIAQMVVEDQELFLPEPEPIKRIFGFWR